MKSSSSSDEVEYLYSVKNPKSTPTKPSNDPQNPESTTSRHENKSISILTLINDMNISIDPILFSTALQVITKHGIGGSRLFTSDMMQDICQTVAYILLKRLPEPEQQSYTPYVCQYVPYASHQLLKTPFKQIVDEKFPKNLFKGKETSLIREIYNWDLLYKVSLYISNERLPENYQFAEEMETPAGWTPFEDFLAITTCPFLEKVDEIFTDKKLPFQSLQNLFPSLKKWLLDRIMLIVRETIKIIPENFPIYEKVGEKFYPKKIGDISTFQKLNKHVLYPKRLSVQHQKKLLRIIYLYGIPKKNGVKKIKEIMQNRCIHEDLITLFVVKLLKKAINIKPDLHHLLSCFPEVSGEKIVDIDWINNDALKAVAINIDLLYKVRENFAWLNGLKPFENKHNRIVSLGLPEWSKIRPVCSWWNYHCDTILFNLTAYYGFLFNSYYAFYIKNTVPDFNVEISRWREKEAFNLTPLKNKNFDYLDPVLSIDDRIERISLIVHFINKAKESEKKGFI